ncbi:MAG: DUF1501 domain-containing protein [Gemmataceae bacterium]
MLKLVTSRRTPACDGGSRRDFLKIGALGATGVLLPDLLRARAANTGGTRNTSVVWLWLGGGPTHVETFDPKMSAPSEYRSVTGSVTTNVPGIDLGGNFTRMAKVADKMAFVRSFAHRNSGHGGGTHWVMTGYDFAAADNGAPANKPGIGAIVSRYRGANNPSTGLPTYVRSGGILGDGPTWLGAPYAPFDVQGRARQNMTLQVQAERLGDRKSLLKEFDSVDRTLDRSGLMAGMDSFEQQAFDLITSKAKDVFDPKREDPRTRDQYGKGLGEQMLMARRLCEAGVGFVTIHYGGWDMHGGIKEGMNRLGPEVDRAVSAFVDDCFDRGLNDDVLLVITGEFGRTPRINGSAGRDHWAPLSTLALSGGGLKMGQVVGESNSKVEVPKTTPIGPQDLMATVFHVLGLPQDLQYKDPTGRPTSMIVGGKPITELV